MGTHSRRRFFELAGVGTAVALAGCSNMPAESEGTATTTETEASTETTTETDDETTETDEPTETTMSSVFHFSEGNDYQKHAVANVANLLNDDSTDTETIALVANGVGVKLLTTDTTEAKTVKSLAKKGVKFKACHNSMNKLNYAKADLLSGVEVVPAGVGELTKLQAKKGYAYIKTP